MRSVIMRASVLVSLSFFACSEDADDTADGAASATQSTEAGVTQSDSADADSNAASSGDDGVDTGAEDAGGDGDDDAAVPICVTACATVADCVVEGNDVPPFGEANYACERGACVYTGCNNDAECSATSALVCRDQGAGTSTCVPTCQSNADCGDPNDTAGPYGTDNYACMDGGCVYVGCNTNDECATLGAYACHTIEGFSFCAQTCAVATDCVAANALAPFDEDNYTCTAGICTYTGCTGTAECGDLGDGYICQ